MPFNLFRKKKQPEQETPAVPPQETPKQEEATTPIPEEMLQEPVAPAEKVAEEPLRFKRHHKNQSPLPNQSK